MGSYVIFEGPECGTPEAAAPGPGFAAAERHCFTQGTPKPQTLNPNPKPYTLNPKP